MSSARSQELAVLVTGAGAPGIAGTLYSLRENYDARPVCVVCTDCQDGVVGSHLGDEFAVIPHASCGDEYVTALLDVCLRHRVKVVLPQNTSELSALARAKKVFRQQGVQVLVSSQESIETANDKQALMDLAQQIGVPVGERFVASTFAELEASARRIGWPDKPVVVKPPVSNGSRGVRIIDEQIDLRQMFYDAKPTQIYTKMHDLHRVLGDEFPALLVTEHLPGMEFSVDVLRTDEDLIVIPRKRERVHAGITFSASLANHAGIIQACTSLAEHLDLRHCFGFQFKVDSHGTPKLLESNPRIQGTMVASTLAGANIIYSSVKAALGESLPRFNVCWDTTLERYWGAIGLGGAAQRRI